MTSIDDRPQGLLDPSLLQDTLHTALRNRSDEDRKH